MSTSHPGADFSLRPVGIYLIIIIKVETLAGKRSAVAILNEDRYWRTPGGSPHMRLS